MRNNLEGAALRDILLEKGIKGLCTVITLGGAHTFDADTGFLAFIDPGGATRVVTLPDPATDKGNIYIVVNTADAAEDLTMNDPAATTRGTISQNEFAIVTSDGARHYIGVVTTT